MNINPIGSMQLLRNAVRVILANETQPTSERIRELINIYRSLPEFQVSKEEAEHLAREIESSLTITMSIGAVVKEEFKEWLSAAKKDIDPYYWDRYHLLLEQKNFPTQVISKLDEVTDRILGLLENPKKDGSWDRRGMVVGHVQSGKTANYTGLICKAADAGYRLIIVIAGTHNKLRNQTQERIDEGFVGRDSSRLQSGRAQRFIGVGRFDTRRRPLTVTNSTRDFNKQTAEMLGVELRTLKEPAILVIKKNASTLKNVISWLREHNASGDSRVVDAPMLLIDDEADNASIDISQSPEEASRINSQIRELLELFHRKCYMGYTATPFANIFIDPETEHEMLGADLFPRDFIISLDAPSNYLGATRVFGESADRSIVKHITDSEDLLPINHKINFNITQLPRSLEDAIRTFILTRAIRLLRGQENDHNSMLVNASRFVGVQSQLRNMIHGFLERVKRRVRFECAKPVREALKDEEIQALHDVWLKEYADLGQDWESVQAVLHHSIAPIQVVEVNSQSSGVLNYRDHAESGLNVIAVGGFTLSRGLTLEGLTVSYFLRNSIMYDTLMQMGRWFGYRPYYEDICRIWMLPEAEGWYEHITESIEELREELREMEQARLTPKEFGLKVRSHPDALIVTARNKMRSAREVKVKIGLDNAFIETTTLWRSSNTIEANRLVTRRLIERMQTLSHFDSNMPEGNYFWKDIPAELVLDFIGAFRNHPLSALTDSKPVQEYIRRRAEDRLAKWDVVLISIGAGQESHEDGDLGLPVRCQVRTAGKRTTGDMLVVSNRQRVSSRGVERIGLSPEERSESEAQYRTEKNSRPGERLNYPDLIYRKKRKKPLLILHLLWMQAPGEHQPQKPLFNFGVAAWGISFPKLKDNDSTVEYVVNTTWWRENYGQDVDEEDLIGDDAD